MSVSRLARGVFACLACASGAAAQDPAPAPTPAPDGETRLDADRLAHRPDGLALAALLRQVPGVLTDRSDVAGSGLAQQPLVVSGGDAGPGTTFSLDGFDVTDPAALGFSSVFFDLSLADAVTVRTAGADARASGAGAQIAVALQDPRDAFSANASVRGTGNSFTWDNQPDALGERPFARSSLERRLDWSASAGGPLGRGRVTLWGAASRQQLEQQTASGHDETLRVTSWLGRVAARLGDGRTSLLVLRNEKVHENRDPVPDAAPAALWKQAGPTTLFGIHDERQALGLALATRLLWLDSGFRLDPYGGDAVEALEDYRGVFRGSYQSFDTDRPRREATLEASRAFRALSREHQASFGLDYARSEIATRARWPGDGAVGLERRSVFFQAFALAGYAQLTRPQAARSTQARFSAWLGDSASFGPFRVDLGARLMRQSGRSLASSAPANPLRPDLLPGATFAGAQIETTWLDVLPRASVAWDAAGDGHFVVRGSYAAYAAFLGPAEILFDDPLAQTGSLTWYWNDRDGDRSVDADEVDLTRPLQSATGVDPADPGRATSANAIAPDLESPRTHEWRVALAYRPSPRWDASFRASWRRLTNALFRPIDGLTSSDYVITASASGALYGMPFDVAAFSPDPASAGAGRTLRNRHGYGQDTVTLELAAARHVGEQGLVSGFVVYQDWAERFTDRALSVQDPTPLDTEPLQDGGALFSRPSGFERADIFVNARWSAGLEARAVLPGSVDASALLSLRDGFPIPYYQTVFTGDPYGSAKRVLVAGQLDAFRMPAVALLDLRVARDFATGRGTLTPALELGNVLNRATTLQVRRDAELPRYGTPREILRPRTLVLSASWRF